MSGLGLDRIMLDMSHFVREASKKGKYMFYKDGYTITFAPPLYRSTYFD